LRGEGISNHGEGGEKDCARNHLAVECDARFIAMIAAGPCFLCAVIVICVRMFEQAREKYSRVRMRVARDLLRRSRGDDAAPVPASGPRSMIHVRGFDNVEVVFDDEERRPPSINLRRGEELLNVIEVEAP